MPGEHCCRYLRDVVESLKTSLFCLSARLKEGLQFNIQVLSKTLVSQTVDSQ